MPQLVLSIIVINYNYGHFLREAIDSALAVEWDPKEIIVVDDGSSDNSGAIILSYGDRVVPVFKPNGGHVSAVNQGFARSKGDVIIFLDADDRIHADAARVILKSWEKCITKVQFPVNVISADGRDTGRSQPNFTKIAATEQILQSLAATTTYVSSPQGGNAYARAFLSEIFPLPEECTYPDNLINAVAPLYGGVVTLLTPLVDYRHHGYNSFSAPTLDIEKLVKSIKIDFERLSFLELKAKKCGFRISKNALMNSPYHLAASLAVKKYAPSLSPSEYSAVKIAYLGICASFRYRCIAVGEKVVLIIWFMSLAAAPRWLTTWLILLRYVPGCRPRWASGLIRWLRVRAA
jgi:glycosyltransferase involved in cell wall biosynthesis